MKKKVICIMCPMSCIIESTYNKKKIFSVEGNGCERGKEYVKEEIFHPKRIITTTVRIKGAAIELVPVKTEKSIPHELCFKVIKCANKICVKAPIKMGDVIIENILGTGVNLIATCSLERIREK